MRDNLRSEAQKDDFNIEEIKQDIDFWIKIYNESSGARPTSTNCDTKTSTCIGATF